VTNATPTTEEKLTLLVESGTIASATMTSVLGLMPDLDERFSGGFDEGLGQMLLVHLAMAVERVRRGEDIEHSEALDGVSGEALQRARLLLARLSATIGIDIGSQAEIAYVAAYLEAIEGESR